MTFVFCTHSRNRLSSTTPIHSLQVDHFVCAPYVAKKDENETVIAAFYAFITVEGM